MTRRDTFEDIYAKVADKVTADAARRRVRRPPLRDPSVAGFSVLDVPRSALLEIVDDEAFLNSSYLVLLDVVPTPRQSEKGLRQLRSGKLSRTDLWDVIMASPAFVASKRKVRFT